MPTLVMPSQTPKIKTLGEVGLAVNRSQDSYGSDFRTFFVIAVPERKKLGTLSREAIRHVCLHELHQYKMTEPEWLEDGTSTNQELK
jgi:hypothetical protein